MKTAEQAQAVFITGASSGIGRACALHLDGAGFQVFAGIRKKSDAEALQQQASSRLTTVLADVTDSAGLEAAADRVASLTGNRLHGLINNAGIAIGGPLELMAPADLRSVLEVNTAGVLAATRAFLPLLRQSRGKIITVGSTSGILGLPGLSAYAASKFAVRGLSDSLRAELRPLGIRVIVLETGNVETPIWDKGIEASAKMLEEAEPELRKLYEPLVQYSIKIARISPKIPVLSIARRMEKILRTSRPRAYYSIGADTRLFQVLQQLPCPLRDRLIGFFLPAYGHL